MRITYFALLLAATILNRDVVAQEETQTPPLAIDSRIDRPVYESGQPKLQHLTTPAPYRPRPDTTYNPTPWPLKKKPTHTTSTKTPPSLNAPSGVSATIAPRYQPRPNTVSRITPTPVPDTPFDPFAGRHHPAGSNSRTFTFPSGVKVEIETMGDDVAFTYANGHRRVVHKHDLNHKPTGAHPEYPCGEMLRFLLRSNPESEYWRRAFVDWNNHC